MIKGIIKKYLSRRGAIQTLINRVAVFFHKAYENSNYNFNTNGEAYALEKIKKSGTVVKTIFDVGANKGNWSVIASKLFSDAKIYSFEVLPSTFQLLKQKTLNNENIHCQNVGLSNSNENLSATVVNKGSGLTTLVTNFSEEFHSSSVQYIEVKTITGDEFCKQHNINGIDILKIDVEGFENKVLQGLEEMFSLGKIKIVQFEYGYVNVKTHFLLYDFYKFFENYGMKVGKIYPTYVEFRNYRYQDENFLGPNYLAVHESFSELIEELRTKNI